MQYKFTDAMLGRLLYRIESLKRLNNELKHTCESDSDGLNLGFYLGEIHTKQAHEIQEICGIYDDIVETQFNDE